MSRGGPSPNDSATTGSSTENVTFQMDDAQASGPVHAEPKALDWLSSVLHKGGKSSSDGKIQRTTKHECEDLLFKNLSGTYSLLKSAKFKKERFSKDYWREYRSFMVKAYKKRIRKKSAGMNGQARRTECVSMNE